jgi:DNA-binding LacI/PurR family transcriptional regulator
MIRLPRRVSLVTETTATLKEWISSGILSDVLPGEMQLKRRLGVGRDTLRLSLKVLEREGWISAGNQGQQRRALKQPLAPRKPPAAEKLPVTFLSPLTIVDRIILLELEDLQKRLTEQGRELRFISPNIFHLRSPERHLRRIVDENPSAAWILYFVSEAFQRWFEKEGVPTFVYGTPFPDLGLPFVVNDWESAAFHAGVQLIRLGHTVIGYLQFENPMPGSALVASGLRRALQTIQPRGALLAFKDDSTPQSVVHSLESAFAARPRPTALVFCSSNQLLTCLSWMVSKGISAPRDVSLISIPSDSWYHELCPPLCYYQNNSNLFARLVGQRVMELVETGEVASRSMRVRLEYKRGATIGPPPNE